MPRGEFGKAFGEYKRAGGTKNRKEFAEEYKKREKPTTTGKEETQPN